MDGSRTRIPVALAMAVGVVAGWLGAAFRATPMRASSADRAGECVVATGPVLMEYDDASKSPIPLEALYFIDYKDGKLLATIPSYRMAGDRMDLIDGFVERDLIADFKIDLDGGVRPRFLMSTGSLGRFSAGWAPLYVFETTTHQVGVYRMQVGQKYGEPGSGRFDLVQVRPYRKGGDGPMRP